MLVDHCFSLIKVKVFQKYPTTCFIANVYSLHHYGGPEQLRMVADPVTQYLTPTQKRDLIAQLTKEMHQAAEDLAFERAAELRDSIAQLEKELEGA